YEIDFVSITHSILEPNALVIQTPLGRIVHTGDWKLDPDPQIGDATDGDAFQALGDDGVLALVCDSTNALVPGTSGSEGMVRENLSALIATLKGRVAVTAFASNVARLESVANAARETDRELVLVGRSMHRIVNAARATGYLKNFPRVLSEDEAQDLAPHRVLYLCTGSQGEMRSALARIAQGDHRSVKLGQGDSVVFSSRIIPGNEISIFEMQNQLAALGVEIITDHDHAVHVSGHPCQDELAQMYRWTRPEISIAVHGERRQQEAHARLAKSLQVKQALVPENGQLFRIAPGRAKLIDEVPSGRIFLDGTVLISDGEGFSKSRRAMAYAGLIVVTLVLDSKGRLATEPLLLMEGIPAAIRAPVVQALDGAVRRHNPKKQDDADLKETVRRAVRRAANDAWGKKPITRVETVSV
ncbi:MAG TPA: ribonuclease J, partial [Rhizomicrobium sp.]|nr:ribonuclease J [Rhizomicrobium sp.]